MPPSVFHAKVYSETLLAESVGVQHFPQQRKIQLGMSSACWTHTGPWDGKRCTQRHRESWLKLLQDSFLSSLKGHGEEGGS